MKKNLFALTAFAIIAVPFVFANAMTNNKGPASQSQRPTTCQDADYETNILNQKIVWLNKEVKVLTAQEAVSESTEYTAELAGFIPSGG